MNEGESYEMAASRELREETNLDVPQGRLNQYRTYSNPKRDPRKHIATTVFYTIIDLNTVDIKAQDDAAEVMALPIKDVLNLDLVFDHREIITNVVNDRSYYSTGNIIIY